MQNIENHHNSRNKVIILFGFFFVLLLIAILMVLATTRIQDNERQIKIVTQELNDISHVFVMRDAANNRALILYRMAETDDDFLRDDLYSEFRKHGANFMSSFSELDTGMKHQKDIDMFAVTKKVIQKGGQNQNITVVDIIEGRIEKAYKLLDQKIIPIQLEVRDKLTKLSGAFKVNSDSELVLISKQNKISILLITILGLFAIALGFIITYYITRRVTRTEIAFIEQRQIAEHASQAKTMFLATMSHEIRSPLTAIIGFSDALRNSDLTKTKSLSCIDSIHRNGEHLLQLINDILDITKIESGQLDVELIEISPFTMVTEFQSSILDTANRKGLKFNINYTFPLPNMITTDPTRVKQILLNLTSNAIKFTSKGGININISLNKNKTKMIFDVIDTGIGLYKDQIDKIFDSFTQADSSTTRNYGGSGLGLNICKLLVEKLGGKIIVESTPGRGSKFSFNIEIGNIDEDNLIYALSNVKNDQNLDITTDTPTLTGNVLLAEDTEDNQNLIEMYVTETGAEITIVNNGKEAVDVCQSRKFDLILMDMQMPVMDGIEAIKIIRKKDSSTPIISLTANAMKSDFEKCIDAGATEFLTKPINTERFTEVLFKYLSKKEHIELKDKKPNKLQKLIDRFLKDLPTRLGLINELYENKNWQELENETHKLKAIGTPLGFPDITHLSNDINLYCRDDEFDKIPVLMEKLNEFCESIL